MDKFIVPPERRVQWFCGERCTSLFDVKMLYDALHHLVEAGYVFACDDDSVYVVDRCGEWLIFTMGWYESLRPPLAMDTSAAHGGQAPSAADVYDKWVTPQLDYLRWKIGRRYHGMEECVRDIITSELEEFIVYPISRIVVEYAFAPEFYVDKILHLFSVEYDLRYRSNYMLPFQSRIVRDQKGASWCHRSWTWKTQN